MADARCYTSSIGWVAELPIAHLSLIYEGDAPKCIYTDRGGARNCGSGPYYQWTAEPYIEGFEPSGISEAEWASGRYHYTGYSENRSDYYFMIVGTTVGGVFQRYEIIGGRVYQDRDSVFLVQPDFSHFRSQERSDIVDAVREWLLTSDGPKRKGSWSRGKVVTPTMECRFSEFETFLGLCEFQIYTHGSASRFQAAYVDAYQNLPQAATNSMANVVMILETLKDMVTKGPIKAFLDGIRSLKDPRDAWLSYRYVYTTTKLDVSEYREFLSRVLQLKDFSSQSVSCAGHFSDDTGSYRCEICLPLSRIIPTDLSDWLSKCGFNLNATNIWDMIPYSFVVDWFIGVSDLTSYLENWSGALELSPKQIWLTYMNEYDEQHYFYRVPGTRMSIPPAYHDKVVSQRTFTMRCADTISLFSKR